MANKIDSLKNVVPLGVLQDGIYPSKSDKEIVYLYYRTDGNLYKYNTIDNIEVNLTKSSAYNTTILFLTDTVESVNQKDITDFEHITIEESKAVFNYKYSYETSKYIFILVPIVYGLHSIFIDDLVNTNLFTLKEIYQTSDGLTYNVFRTTTSVGLNTSVKITTVLNSISDDTFDTLATHIEDKDNPHNVTKAQIGLPNVDNTSDSDKPISNAVAQAISSLSESIASKISFDVFNSLKEAVADHIESIENPHQVTKSQIGLGNVDNTSDIEKPISKAVQQSILNLLDKINSKADSSDLNTLKDNVSNHVNNTNNPHKLTPAQIGLNELSKIFFRQVGYKDEVIDLYIRRGTKEELKSIPIVNRQLLFETDTRTLYFDHCNVREAYGSGNGFKIEVDPNANDLTSDISYYCIGNKTNFPAGLNGEDTNFILLNGKTNVSCVDDDCDECEGLVSQLIIIGGKLYSRSETEKGIWSDWKLEDISNKQDVIDNNLNTIDKTIVGAINEILYSLKNIYVSSLLVRRIDLVSKLPETMEEDVLYIVYLDEFLGIDYMKVKDPNSPEEPYVQYFQVS